MELLEREHFDVLLTDFRLPNEDGMKLIARAKSLSRPPICILMTAYGSEELAVDAMKRGADDYIAKGRLQIDELEMRIARALRQQNLGDGKREPAPAAGKQIRHGKHHRRIAGDEGGVRDGAAGGADAGDGAVAGRKRHGQGTGRARDPPVQPAQPPAAGDGALRGAVAHAAGERIVRARERARSRARTSGASGGFEQAQGGTLFLDEIGEIDATIQIKLLRFLGERTFERVGSNKTLTADVRLIAATNKNLEELVKAGTFREDLFYRLCVVEIHLPPLRERTGDIPLLAQTFSAGIFEGNGQGREGFHGGRAGNADSLSVAGQRARTAQRARTRRGAVPGRPHHGARPAGVAARRDGAPARSPQRLLAQNNLTVKEAEKQLIMRALKEADGNRTQAAAKIGMSRRTLHRKLHSYHLEDL